MLFRIEERKFESEKERNLYFKFFAGFYFNELIPAYEDRVSEFFALLTTPAYHVGDDPITRINVAPDAVFVSFDNHPDRFRGVQSGEFADILIHHAMNGFLIGIEAKYLDDWDYQKDIVENEAKLKYVAEQLRVPSNQLCLLIPQRKWEHVIAMEAHSGSNYRRLKHHSGSVSVLLWEDLIRPKVVPDEVRRYVEAQLDHPRLRAT